MQELAHSLNIKLDPVVVGRITTLQLRLREHSKERREGDTSPHLSLLLRFATGDVTEDFTRKLSDEFRDVHPFEITFAGCSASESGEYLFLDLDDTSSEFLSVLHHRADDATKGIGSGGKGGEPARFSYTPHVSLIKLLPEESQAALVALRSELQGLKSRVSTLTVSVDAEDRPGEIRVIHEIPLR
jgi:2'-5' RNA ligase